jgi:glycosyltransferase involved in cell wall biosynthesis
MRILLLTDYFPPDKIGGVGEIASHLKSSYEAKGHEVSVLTTGCSRDSERSRRIIRSARSLVAGGIINNFHVLRFMRAHSVDAIHLHQSSTTLFLFLRPFKKRFPFVLNSLQVSYISEAREIKSLEYGGKRFRPAFSEYLEKFLFAPVHIALDFVGYVFSDHVTTVSRDNRRELLTSFVRVRPKPITVIPNGATVPPAVVPSWERDQELEARLANKIVVTYVGVFRVRKRIFHLLYALRDALVRHPNLILLLVGGGRGYEPKITSLVRDLGLEHAVILVGKVPNVAVPYYLHLTDIVCLPSSYEGMPVAILQAMAMGKPVVTTNRFGMRDVIKDSETGSLAPVDDVSALADAIAELASNPQKASAIGQRAREAVRAHYGWDDVAERYLNLIPKPHCFQDRESLDPSGYARVGCR